MVVAPSLQTGYIKQRGGGLPDRNTVVVAPPLQTGYIKLRGVEGLPGRNRMVFAPSLQIGYIKLRGEKGYLVETEWWSHGTPNVYQLSDKIT